MQTGEQMGAAVFVAVLVALTGCESGASKDPSYTDARAVAAMGPVSDDNTLNHTRYSDAEAVSAMGPLSSANPLNHARYSDAEAVSAVESAGLSLGAPLTAPELTVSGNTTVAGSATLGGPVHARCLSRLARYEATCIARAVAQGVALVATVSPRSANATGANGDAICASYLGNNSVTGWTCLAVPYVYDHSQASGGDVRLLWSACSANHGSTFDGYEWFSDDDCSGVLMACCGHT
jgi:hypothetical protein